ncbi:uncharacterized protein RCO7_10044 [Rhynchosporium graminicola]|uniref:Uncharacterized protein n=1 Tax=Rhynchosporium graminicola TaxID=2792576 RepID=A0A1E1L1J6_9HELO|nr:uncharacterized protein RCO7_10044 [Rhynchosporium commune]
MKLVHLIFVPLFLVYANPLESRGANNGCPAPNGCAGICVSKTNLKGEVKDYCNTPNAQFPCGNRRNGIKSYRMGIRRLGVQPTAPKHALTFALDEARARANRDRFLAVRGVRRPGDLVYVKVENNRRKGFWPIRGT